MKTETLTRTDKVLKIQLAKIPESTEPISEMHHSGGDFRCHVFAALYSGDIDEEGPEDANLDDFQAAFAIGLDRIRFGREYVCDVCAFRGVSEAGDGDVGFGGQGRHSERFML